MTLCCKLTSPMPVHVQDAAGSTAACGAGAHTRSEPAAPAVRHALTALRHGLRLCLHQSSCSRTCSHVVIEAAINRSGFYRVGGAAGMIGRWSTRTCSHVVISNLQTFWLCGGLQAWIGRWPTRKPGTCWSPPLRAAKPCGWRCSSGGGGRTRHRLQAPQRPGHGGRPLGLPAPARTPTAAAAARSAAAARRGLQSRPWWRPAAENAWSCARTGRGASCCTMQARRMLTQAQLSPQQIAGRPEAPRNSRHALLRHPARAWEGLPCRQVQAGC